MIFREWMGWMLVKSQDRMGCKLNESIENTVMSLLFMRCDAISSFFPFFLGEKKENKNTLAPGYLREYGSIYVKDFLYVYLIVWRMQYFSIV